MSTQNTNTFQVVEESWSFDTIAVRAGLRPQPFWIDRLESGPNSELEGLEQAVGELDHGFAAAYTCVDVAVAGIATLMPPNSIHVVSNLVSDEIRQALVHLESTRKLAIRWVDMHDPDSVVIALADAAALWLEACAGSWNSCIESEDLAWAVGRRAPFVVIDASAMAPLEHDAIQDGANVVLYSDCGIMAGDLPQRCAIAVCADEQVSQALKAARSEVSTPDSGSAKLIHAGLRTLPLRLRQACDKARTLQQRLASHQRVISVQQLPVRIRPGMPAAWHAWETPGSARLLLEVSEPTPGRLLAYLPQNWCTVKPDGVATHIDWMVQTPDDLRSGRPGRYLMRVGIERDQDLWAELDHALTSVAW